jgi:alpha-N-arabinofuranosidase
MANLAQLVNVLGLIHTRSEDVYCSPLYYAFKLYARHTGDFAVSTTVNSGTFKCAKLGGIPSMEGVPYLDCSATFTPSSARDEDASPKMNADTLTLFVINRHYSDDINAEINLENFSLQKKAQILLLNAPSPASKNSFKHKRVVSIIGRTINGVSKEFTHTFPAHSVTAIVLRGYLEASSPERTA